MSSLIRSICKSTPALFISECASHKSCTKKKKSKTKAYQDSAARVCVSVRLLHKINNMVSFFISPHQGQSSHPTICFNGNQGVREPGRHSLQYQPPPHSFRAPRPKHLLIGTVLLLLSLSSLQRITVPCSEKQQELRIFTFSVTNVARDNPHGSFDCVQQLSTR